MEDQRHEQLTIKHKHRDYWCRKKVLFREVAILMNALPIYEVYLEDDLGIYVTKGDTIESQYAVAA